MEDGNKKMFGYIAIWMLNLRIFIYNTNFLFIYLFYIILAKEEYLNSFTYTWMSYYVSFDEFVLWIFTSKMAYHRALYNIFFFASKPSFL